MTVRILNLQRSAKSELVIVMMSDQTYPTEGNGSNIFESKTYDQPQLQCKSGAQNGNFVGMDVISREYLFALSVESLLSPLNTIRQA
jgi:hypothetical protein